MDIQAEYLAYWYLRLNGFLTIPNFVVHPDTGRNQETDVDVLGVRFPHRAENLNNPMKDDVYFTRVRNKSLVIIAEVKKRQCDLNGPWTNPGRQNMLRILRAIGAFPEPESDCVAATLYEQGFYESQLYYVSLLCLGGERNNELATRYSKVPQILWPEVLGFIYRRFHEYRNQKVSHPQWDTTGQKLWNIYEQSDDEGQFEGNVCVC